MKFLEVGSFGGELAGLGILFLLLGLLSLGISILVCIVMGFMSSLNKEKKYDFKAPLYGILSGILLLIAGGCICGLNI